MQVALQKPFARSAPTGETKLTARLCSTKRYATNSGAVRDPEARVLGKAMLMPFDLRFVVTAVNPREAVAFRIFVLAGTLMRIELAEARPGARPGDPSLKRGSGS
ncbi:hypothetical protein DSM21852_17860 [Methylocystis bryophila]|nr:hypothetical protein DSM21852_17860 [Methylocystis bryophila]